MDITLTIIVAGITAAIVSALMIYSAKRNTIDHKGGFPDDQA